MKRDNYNIVPQAIVDSAELYLMPTINVVDVVAERGFGESSNIDDMFETEGDWE